MALCSSSGPPYMCNLWTSRHPIAMRVSRLPGAMIPGAAALWAEHPWLAAFEGQDPSKAILFSGYFITNGRNTLLWTPGTRVGVAPGVLVGRGVNVAVGVFVRVAVRVAVGVLVLAACR